MKHSESKIVRSVLRNEVGLSWIPLLVKSFTRKRAVFNNSHWANLEGAESEFTKRLSFASALYLELRNKLHKEKAFEIMRKILLPVGCNEQWKHLRTMENRENPMENLMGFNDLMDKAGTPRFNTREYLKQNDSVCHFVITRCIFHDFFSEAGRPELTKLFCEIDRVFFPKAFPDFEFHRGNSWENTIAYGKDRCEFIFQRKR